MKPKTEVDVKVPTIKVGRHAVIAKGELSSPNSRVKIKNISLETKVPTTK